MKSLKLLFACALTGAISMSCNQMKKEKMTESVSKTPKAKFEKNINAQDFITTIEGDSVGFYVLTNVNGMEATFTNYGLRLVSLYVPDKNGEFADVVLGFDNLADYRAKKNFYGAVIGRYGNRIAKGKFTLDGKTYDLAINNNENHLHGGLLGFESVVWKVDEQSDNAISFTRTSPDMEEGYPGNLEVKVSYLLTDDNALEISYEAKTDKPTYVNLTNHSFFNLKGEGEGTVNDHVVMLNADKFTPVDNGLIPTGELEDVAGTPFDFKVPKAIGRDIETDFEQLKLGNGYDHNFVLNETPKNAEGLTFAARVVEPNSGRTLEVYTDEPGVQFYGGNFLDGTDIGKSGKAYVRRGSFCLETQHFPNSPNQPGFPSTRLEPGETYTSHCTYKFGVVEN
ncbi:aldose 1-epimerase [Zobellia uliginosa]|uniref:Aldose 1-epimerase n=1 Tax=Zobellia uliginosa TaxID=143224 RepID=A0ABY1KRK8_9FLAO|nr:aldose epimerase family protein [Zobellia uliginosa]SIS55608.1 aldose 1-epimerase [Zobellia uliginosa]